MLNRRAAGELPPTLLHIRLAIVQERPTFAAVFNNLTEKMNTKNILFAATLVASTSPALAGGFLTNTNHGASFLRMPAQEGYISIEGAYYNPAGIGFLGNGWHFAF